MVNRRKKEKKKQKLIVLPWQSGMWEQRKLMWIPRLEDDLQGRRRLPETRTKAIPLSDTFWSSDAHWSCSSSLSMAGFHLVSRFSSLQFSDTDKLQSGRKMELKTRQDWQSNGSWRQWYTISSSALMLNNTQANTKQSISFIHLFYWQWWLCNS